MRGGVEGEVFVLELAFRLNAFEFDEIAGEVMLGLVAGAVHGILDGKGGEVLHGVEGIGESGLDEAQRRRRQAARMISSVSVCSTGPTGTSWFWKESLKACQIPYSPGRTKGGW